MKEQFRPIAVSLAVIIFFVMALVGTFCGLSPATGVSRAVAGAVITYAVVTLAGQAVISIIMQSIIDNKIKKIIKKNKDN